MAVNVNGCPKDLGTIEASLLSPNDRASLPDGRRWILADGRLVPGSNYEIFISSKVPDLRGSFLRGKNYKRPEAEGNRMGDLALGTFQLHQFREHFHEYQEMILNDGLDGVDSKVVGSYEHRNVATRTALHGSVETRPRNVTVHFYICVN